MQCFNLEVTAPLSPAEADTVAWLLRETYDPARSTPASSLDASSGTIVEVGPRLTFSTAWSANAVSVCAACGIGQVSRIERSRRFAVQSATALTAEEQHAFAALVHDRMTEQVYSAPLATFTVRRRRFAVLCV